MLAAYVHTPEGPAECISSLEALGPYVGRTDVQLWIDIEGADTDAVRHLGEWFHLDAAALEDALTGDPRARIDEFDTYLYLMLYEAVGIADDAVFAPRKLAVFVSEKFLITIHPEPLRSVRQVRGRCDRSAAPLLSRGAGHVLYSILDTMVGHYMVLTDTYEKHLDELEEKSLEAKVDAQLLSGVVPLRRELTELRRRAASVREVIVPIAHDEFDILTESIEHRFNHLLDHLTDVVETIDGQRDILHAILENYHAALAQRTNQTIRILTVFATSLLPVSVMAGIYGMNLPIWPPAEYPWSFWGVLAGMVTVALTTLRLFKRWGLW